MVGQENVTDGTNRRVCIGFIAAWIISVATAFIAGGLYSAVMERSHLHEYLLAIVRMDKDAWTILYFVGYATAFAASIVSTLTFIFIVWSLYLAARKYNHVSLKIYLVGGSIVSLVVIAALMILQHNFSPLTSSDYNFEMISILFSGCLLTFTLLLMMRPDRML